MAKYQPCEIELKWQARWGKGSVFETYNPGEKGFDPGKNFMFLDMFPSIWIRFAWTCQWVHRHGYSCSSKAYGKLQCFAPDGLGYFWVTCRNNMRFKTHQHPRQNRISIRRTLENNWNPIGYPMIESMKLIHRIGSAIIAGLNGSFCSCTRALFIAKKCLFCGAKNLKLF